MDKIFISYRREDSEGFARSLFQSLAGRFGKDQVFMDVEAIGLGMDFVEAIDKSLADCGVLLVLIGKDWAHCTDADGHRRLDNQDDFVRIEVAKALKRNVRVIPVLVKGAPMPGAEDLPEELRSLIRRQALELRHERWDSDVDHLSAALEKLLGIVRKDRPPVPPVQPPAPAKPAGKKGVKIAGLAVAAVIALAIIYNAMVDFSGDNVISPAYNPPVPAAPEPATSNTPATKATPAPSPAPKPVNTSLTGFWIDDSGVRVKIVHNGMYAVSQFVDPASGVMIQANWQFSGRNFEFTWASGAGNNGYGRGTVAADYNSIQYEYIDYVTGLQDSGRLRRALQ